MQYGVVTYFFNRFSVLEKKRFAVAEKLMRYTHTKPLLDALDAGVPLDTAAAHLREAADNLSDITGDRMDEMLLDDIFSKFCVGK